MKFNDAINVIRDRINIVDVVSSYVRLKRSGTNYIGLCPFHNDKNPSMSVSESKQIFKCFSCGKSGNVYNFLMEIEGINFPQAVKELAKKVNVEIDDDYSYNKENDIKKQKLYSLYKDVANTYYKILFSPDGKLGLDYFRNRKLINETIKKFGLGFSPDGFGQVYKMMKEKGYDDNILLEDSKLFMESNVENDNGGRVRDFFYDRVMFPLVDVQGRVISFQGRVIGESTGGKYINTAESIIYKKSRNLFGMNFAKATKKDYLILCEGNMDVVSLHQAGVDNAVASWGTAFTIEQANLIKRKVKKLYLCLDTDEAGIKAINSAVEVCKSADIDTYVVDLRPVKDPDEFINKLGREEFDKRLLNPIPSFLFLISTLSKVYDRNNVYEYEKYVKEIVLRLASFENKMVRDKYIKEVADRENLPLDELTRQVNEYVAKNGVQNASVIHNYVRPNNDTVAKDKNVEVEEYFINFLLENVELSRKVFDIVNIDEINDKVCVYIYKLLIEGKNTNDILDVLNKEDDEFIEKVKKVLFGKDVFNDNNDNKQVDDGKYKINVVNELIRKIKINNLEKFNVNDFDKAIEINNKINEIKKTVFINNEES